MAVATALDYRGNVVVPAVASNEGSATAPASGTAITSVSLVPGTYVLAWTVALTSGTPVAADSSNFGLYSGATLQEQSATPGALGSWPQQPVQITLTATTTIAVKAVGNATGGVVYAAELVATPVLQEDPDAQNLPWGANPLTADGNTVTLGSGQTVTLNGFDATGSQAECQLGRGSNIPSGTSDQGFVDTTYTLTAAQLLAGSQMGA